MEAVKGTADRFAFDTDVRQAPRLNRVAAIYGPNGSGKSRFVEGLDFAQTFVLNSSRENQAGDAIPHQPFLFDEESRKSPTVFETTFIQDGTLYQYGFEVDAVRVHREWLLAWPPGEGCAGCWSASPIRTRARRNMSSARPFAARRACGARTRGPTRCSCQRRCS